MKFKIKRFSPCDKTLPQIRVSAIAHENIKKIAKENKISMSEIVRQMIEFCLEDQIEEVKDA